MCRRMRQVAWEFRSQKKYRDTNHHCSAHSRAHRRNSFWLWHSNRQPGNPLGRNWFSSRSAFDAVPRSKGKTIMAESVSTKPARSDAARMDAVEGARKQGDVAYFDGR